MALLLGAGIAASGVEPSQARPMITRIERCNRLDKQLETVLTSKRTARHANAARALQRKARKYCATRREAQGIRAFADALKMLGVKPIDDNRMRPKTASHAKGKRS